MPLFPPGGGGAGSVNFSAGAASANLGSVVFGNGSGVTFGLNASTITASVAGAGAVSFSGGTSSAALGSLVFSNGSGVSFGLNGSTLTATVQTNYLTTAMLSNAATISAVKISAGAASANLSALTFADGGGVSFGFNASTLTASVSQTVQTQGMVRSLNGSESGMSISAGNLISISNNASTVNVINVLSSSAIANPVSSASAAGTLSSRFALADHAHAGINSVSLVGNTSGTTSAGAGSLVIAGGPNITLSASTAAGGMTVSVSAPAPGGGAALTASYYNFNFKPLVGNTALTLGGSSMFVEPFVLPYNLSGGYLRIPMSVGMGSSTTGTTANISLTFNQTDTHFAIFYSQGTGASSRSLQSIYSSTLSMVYQVRYQVGAASNNQTCSHNITYGNEGASNSNFATNYNVNSASMNVSTTHLTSFSGARFMDIPFGTLMAPGNYWLGVARSSATAQTGVWAAMTNLTSRGSYYAISQISSNINLFGANTTAGSNGWLLGNGFWSTNSVGATSASLNLAQISTIANQPLLPFQIIRQA